MKQLLLKTVVLLFFTIIISCISKDDPKDQLPPITQTGANTFGCVINGKYFVPSDAKTWSPGPQPKGLNAGFTNNNFKIYAADLKNTNGLYIYVYIYNLTQTGVYDIGQSNGETIDLFSPSFSHIFCTAIKNSERNVYYSNNNSGTITITHYDNINFIYSGTFSFTATNKDDATDTIAITDGRFDLNLNTLNN